ncbi:MAG: hypothetical protein AAGA31_08140 [Bacteroidota bacterium]
MNNRILQHKFNDSKQGILSVVIIHLLLGILLLLPYGTTYLTWGRPQLCLTIGFVFLIIYRFYQWDKGALNFAIPLFYLFTLLFEWVVFGLPAVLPLAIAANGTPSKGVLMDLFFIVLPYIYLLLRVIMLLVVSAPTLYASKNSKEE